MNMTDDKKCACGREHTSPADTVLTGSKVVSKLPEVIKKYDAGKAFVLSDKNTYKAGGEKVCDILKAGGIEFSSYVLDKDMVEPNEENVGSVIMHYDNSCDIVIAVGSGVINDIGKILSSVADKPYVIVATAPSMDGYASATSSMTRDGLKVSIPSKSAEVIIGDTDILCRAPEKMLVSGLGDMLAKYVSICEWRISNLITGEYYCEEIAELVRKALKKCTDNADGLLKRDKIAVEAVFEGLVTCGLAMTYAGLSRPASGVEHYLSHIWDMRGAEFGTKVDLHGIQCGIGTYIAVKLYDKIKGIVPDKDKAMGYVSDFDFEKWSEAMRAFLGKGAESMIKLEAKERKYDKIKHSKRIDVIIENWDKIIEIINEELPSVNDFAAILRKINAPETLEEIGLTSDLIPMSFKASKDIRDKYVLSRLCWDLGILDEII